MKNMKWKTLQKTLIAFGVVLLFAVGFMFLGMFVDIQVISKYDYTPISFTFLFGFGGALVGLLLMFRTIKHLKVAHS